MSGRAGSDVLRPGDGRPSSTLARIAAMLEMELRVTSRRLENLFVTLGLPAVLLVFFGAVEILPDAATAATGARPIDGTLPAILATAIVAAGFVNLGISTGFERSYGVLKRLGASPLTRGQLVAGKIGTILVVEVIQAVLLIGLAVGIFGWAPGPGWSPLAVVAAVALGTAAFSSLGLLFAGSLRAEATMARTTPSSCSASSSAASSCPPTSCRVCWAHSRRSCRRRPSPTRCGWPSAPARATSSNRSSCWGRGPSARGS